MKGWWLDPQPNKQKDFCNLSALCKAEKKTCTSLKKYHHIYTREPNLVKGKINSSPDLIQVKNSPSKLMIYSKTSTKITSV